MEVKPTEFEEFGQHEDERWYSQKRRRYEDDRRRFEDWEREDRRNPRSWRPETEDDLLWARGKEKEKAMERRRKRGNMPEEGLPEKEERRAELEIDQGPMKYGSSGGASPRLGC